MSAPFLSLDWFSVPLGKRKAVSEITVSFPRSCLVALVGPNGAGKSSLLHGIAGLAASTGVASLGGRALNGINRAQKAKLIGYLPQGHVTHWPLPVRDIVALGRFPHGVTDPARLSGDDADKIAEAMAMTGITALADRKATALSGGERARVALARVLALGAPLILADEPTASLDPRYQLDVMTLLQRTAAEGALVIAVTHDLAHAALFADVVLVMNGGAVIACGPPEAALTPKVMAEVFHVRTLDAEAHDRRLLVPWEVVP